MQNLFENYDIRYKKNSSERGDFISYFMENLRNKDGKPFSAKIIAIKLSHIPTKDLYHFKSVFSDIKNRNGDESANKYFWWALKIDKKDDFVL